LAAAASAAPAPAYYPVPQLIQHHSEIEQMDNSQEVADAKRANGVLDLMRALLKKNPTSLTPAQLAQATAELESVISIAVETQPRLWQRVDDCWKYQGDVKARLNQLQPKYIHYTFPSWAYPRTNPFFPPLAHSAVKIVLPGGAKFYFDDGWWNHAFTSEDIPTKWVTQQAD
jgi:hypothetical protein